MSDSVIDITHKHGVEMRRLAFQHTLEMAELYRDFGSDPIGQLISYLQEKLKADEEDENATQ